MKNGFGLTKLVIAVAAFAVLAGGYVLFVPRCENISGFKKLDAPHPRDEIAPCQTYWNKIFSRIQPNSTEESKTIGGNNNVVMHNWKTYRSEKYRFEVRYPSKSYADTYKTGNFVFGVAGKEAAPFTFKIYVYLDQVDAVIKEKELEVKSTSEFLVGKIKGIKINYKGNCEGEMSAFCDDSTSFTMILIRSGNYTYELTSSWGDTPAFFDILATFKFIE